MKSIREIAASEWEHCPGFRGPDEVIDFAESVLSAYLAQQEPVAYWIKDAEQFCIPEHGNRPFAKAWKPLFLAPPIKPGFVMVPVEPTIATQDECCTRDPFYVVYGKREVVVDGDYDHDRIAWINTESGDYEEATENQVKRLEKLSAGGRDTKGFKCLAIKEIDEFQTACFTRVGAEAYLSINGHNISKPFIYVHSLYRNNEMLGLRSAMIQAPKENSHD